MIYIIMIIILVMFAISSIILIKLYSKGGGEQVATVSFKESMDITELPIVTFIFKNYENNKDVKLNFLLDSGSNISIINQSVLIRKKIMHNVLFETTSTIGIEGNSVKEVLKCHIQFSYKNHTYEDDFAIQNLDRTFNDMKSTSGVNVHGILGTNFFQKYKYVLDFEELIAYMKK